MLWVRLKGTLVSLFSLHWLNFNYCEAKSSRFFARWYPVFICREQVILTTASLRFYLKSSHSQEKPLLDTAFLEVSGFPVCRAVVFRLAALWLVTHGSWTDRGSIYCLPLGLPVYQDSFSPLQSVMASFWPVTAVLEHLDGMLWGNSCIQRISYKMQTYSIVYKQTTLTVPALCTSFYL